MITDRLDVPVAAFEHATGWSIEPKGACNGDVCVPLPDGATSGDTIDLPLVAERLGMPIVTDEARGVHALGPASISGHALPSAQAPELVLPDLDDRPFRLSSLRGQKVLLVAWAPY